MNSFPATGLSEAAFGNHFMPRHTFDNLRISLTDNAFYDSRKVQCCAAITRCNGNCNCRRTQSRKSV